MFQSILGLTLWGVWLPNVGYTGIYYTDQGLEQALNLSVSVEFVSFFPAQALICNILLQYDNLVWNFKNASCFPEKRHIRSHLFSNKNVLNEIFCLKREEIVYCCMNILDNLHESVGVYQSIGGVLCR